MTFDLPIAEKTLKSTARLFNQSMWLLFVIAASLMFVLRHSMAARTGSVWMLGCAVLAFMLSFALRDVVKKVGHRNTEDKIVKDVKNFLEREPSVPVERRIVPKPVLRVEEPEADSRVPVKAADFVALKGAAPYKTLAGDPVVFDAFPAREAVIVKTNFYVVLQPVAHNG